MRLTCIQNPRTICLDKYIEMKGIMNITKHPEIEAQTDFLAQSKQYQIRIFKSSGNFVVLDEDGDFVVVDRHEAEYVSSALLTNLMENNEILVS